MSALVKKFTSFLKKFQLFFPLERRVKLLQRDLYNPPLTLLVRNEGPQFHYVVALFGLK